MKKEKMPDDMELTSLSTKEASFSLGSTQSVPGGGDPLSVDSIFPSSRRDRGRSRGTVAGWIDSFRRDPHTRVTTPRTAEARRSGTSIEGSTAGDVEEGDVRTRKHRGMHYFDLRAAAVGTANPLLARELKGRHLQMIAIGGSIGMSWFSCCF
jgi:amino acid transporter